MLVHNARCETGDSTLSKGAIPKTPKGPGSMPKGQRDPKRVWTKQEKADALAKRGGKCDQCNQTLNVDAAKGHHIVRHADGGQTAEHNLAVLCDKCHHGVH